MPEQISFNIELIIEEYTPYVYKVIDNLAGPKLTKEDKEDIISDTFYLLWKNQDKVKSNLKSYLAKIAKNCVYHKLKNLNRTFELNEEIIDSVQKSLDDSLIVKELLDKLTENEMYIFNLYYINGYKIKEIAKKLGKSVTNIKVCLYRIRKKIKEV